MGDGIKDLSNYLPIIEVARSYRREDLPHDVVAGVAVGMLTVPQAVAYALLAGLPAQAGLYACLAPMVIHALLSSSRQLIVGPVAIAALMVASTVGQHAAAYSDAYLGITTVLSLQVGLILILLRALQVGGIVNLLSHPVISGFVNGAAVVIIISQLAPLTGIATTSRLDDGALDRMALLVRSVGEVNPTAIALGVGSLLLMAAVRRWGPALVRSGARVAGDGDVRHALGRTGPVLVTVLGTAVVAGFGLDVGVVGSVPAGLPEFTLPLLDARLWWDLAPNAVLIALVAFVESYSIGKTLAARQRRRIDSHQELLALGAANIGASLSGAYPVAGSFSRSSVNYASGARTPASALVCAVIIVLTLLWLMPLFANLPHAVLAAVVIVAVYELADFRSVVRDWRFYRGDVLTHFATFAGVLLAGVEAGLLIGVGISVVLFMRGSARPHIAVVGRLGDTPHFRNVKRYEVRTWPHLVAARVDESFYFANADTLESRLAELVDNPEGMPEDGDSDGGQAVEHLLIIMSAVNFIDTTGLEMLQRLTHRLARRGVAMHLCEIKGPVRDQLEHVAVDEWLSGRVFQTTDDAFNVLTEAAGKWVWRDVPEKARD
ncbi:MAG: sulfate permease [Gammaproteobacteria bacterium]|nr:sulfate permease [Gammaproteobacteria bacterium]